VPTDQPGLAGRFASVKEPYLTEEDAQHYYHETSGALHASWKYLGGPAFDRHVIRLAQFHDERLGCSGHSSQISQAPER
jgi:hypothetical protein